VNLRRHLAAAAALLLTPAWCFPAAAQETPAPSAQVQVTPLLGENHRPGRFAPLAVEVRAGAAPIRDAITLTVDGGPAFRIALDLPANGRVRHVLPITAAGATARVTVRAGWQPADADPIAVVRLRRPPPDAALVVAVAVDGGEQREFALLGSERHLLIQRPASTLPRRAELLEMADCCLLGALAEGALHPESVAALAEWVRAGGTVLLADPDLLRRAPALDRALFPPRGAEESLPPAIEGLPGHFAQALRSRGLGPRDVVYDTSGTPHHIRFRSGLGAGALLLQPIAAEAGRTVMARLWKELGVPRGGSVPTLAPGAIAAFPPAAPGGWPRTLLALWLLAVPCAGWLWRRRRAAGAGLLAGAAVIATWLGVAATAPIARVVTLARLGPEGRIEQVVHVASARDAALALGLDDAALPRPLVRRTGELHTGLGTVEWGDAPKRWTGFDVDRGAARTAALAPAARPEMRLLGVQAGRRLLVSNESGVALTACLLAWRGRMADLGAFGVGEVRSVEFPERLDGPVQVLEQVGARDGVPVARALRVARTRIARGDQPQLLAATGAAIRPAPTLYGAATELLPAVLIAPITQR
jgi:hypothetical protein